jgi:hypothetical protein
MYAYDGLHFVNVFIDGIPRDFLRAEPSSDGHFYPR